MASPVIVPKRIDLIAALPRGSVIAEIGVRRGEFSVELMELPNIAKLYCVDAWRKQTWSAEQQEDEEHQRNYHGCLHNLRGHLPGGRVEIIRESSLCAVLDSRIPLLDAGYIDAAHDVENALADLRAWATKLKPGGVLMGHDYCDNEETRRLGFGVVEAVDIFCRNDRWKITHLTAESFPSFRLEPL